MKGDFTRDSFRPEQAYNRVLLQQGRVPLDADWNEAQAIDRHLERTALTDVIGQSGVPLGGSFQLTGNNGALTLGKGRLYVDGILCENPADYEIPGSAAFLAGNWFVYLEVTERHITALEDPEIREKALGGVDTATRVKTHWEVKAVSYGDVTPTCEDAFAALPGPTTARLAARAKRPDDVEACTVTPGARFRRLENQLYRVEVHQTGDLANATFKWSRDNGTVAALATIDAERRIAVSDIGRDAFLTFQSGGWIELTDEARDSARQPGEFFWVSRIEGNVLILDPNQPGVVAANFGAGLRARRWDSKGAVPFVADDDGFMRLEDGVGVKITGNDFRSGDYWLIPARTIDSDVWWPKIGADPAALPPHGVQVHYAPLGIVFAAGIIDCRNEFVPLNQVKSLYYLGGDGQSYVETGNPIPATVKPTVGVSRGEHPVANAVVRWTLGTDSGVVASATTVTNAEGVTQADWTLHPSTSTQTLTAQLLDSSLQPTHLPITFTASIAPPAVGGSCCHTVGIGGEFATIEAALDRLLEIGQLDICLCLLPGEHVVDGISITGKKGGADLNSLSIHGHLGGSFVRSTKPWLLTQLRALVLKDIYGVIGGSRFAIGISGCFEVRIENCTLIGVVDEAREPIIVAGLVGDLLVRDSLILCATPKDKPEGNPIAGDGNIRAGFGDIRVGKIDFSAAGSGGDAVASLNQDPEKFAASFAKLKKAERRLKFLETSGFLASNRFEMSPNRRAALGQITEVLRVGTVSASRLAAPFARLAEDGGVGYKIGLGIALVLLDAAGAHRIEDNSFGGIVGLYGMPGETRLDINNAGNVSEVWEENQDLILKPGGVLHFHHNEAYGLFLGEEITNYQSEYWSQTKAGKPPTTPEPVYANVHVSDNSFVAFGMELFGTLVTVESNTFLTNLPERYYAMVALTYRSAFTGNVSFMPQRWKIVAMPTPGFENPGYAEAGNLNLFF
jgi:hypothetical protein